MGALVLTEADLKRCLDLDAEAISIVEQGFTCLAEGGVDMPPVMRIDVPENNGECDVKTAYVPGFKGFAVKMSSGFFNNDQLGLPSLSGMVVLLSATTGFPLAVMLDNGYLTNLRTGAAGAVAAKHLAPADVQQAGVIGAGVQARFQMIALQHIRQFSRLLVTDLIPQRADAYAEEMTERLGIQVRAVEGPEAVVRNSQVVVTTTPSKSPYLRPEWLHPGLHITAMGSDAESKQELHAEALGRADRLVCDRKSQAFRLGELHHGLEAGVVDPESPITELGAITSGQAPGREDGSEITICDLTGTGVQDTVIASLGYERAVQAGLGLEIAA
ncbi:MAG: cyclodeaminase [Candidatus Methylomirabilales bacterium]